MSATFNGVSLGHVFWMIPSGNPHALQINAYPGANGLEVLRNGSRGGRTSMEGAVIADNAASLASAEATLRAYQVGGGAYTLSDTLGTSWTNVIMVGFQPKGRVLPVAGGKIARKYDAEFLHVF